MIRQCAEFYAEMPVSNSLPTIIIRVIRVEMCTALKMVSLGKMVNIDDGQFKTLYESVFDSFSRILTFQQRTRLPISAI